MGKVSKIADHSLKVLEYDALLEVLANFASTSGGKDYVLALKPLTERGKIETLLKETTEFRGLIDRGCAPIMGEIKDLSIWFADIGGRRVPFEPNELNDIASAFEGCLSLKTQLKGYSELLPLMSQWTEKIADLTELSRAIRDVVSPDDTIRDSASKELKELRGKIAKLDAAIKERLQRIMNAAAVKDALENRNILERNGRPVLALKAPSRRAVAGVVHDKSQTGQTVYVEPQAVFSLVNELEETRYDERREITRILWSLTSMLAERALSALMTAKAVVYIDATLAKARFSASYECIEPSLTKDGSLQLKGARHPLLGAYIAKKGHMKPRDAMQRLTPLDIRLGEEFNIVVVTGPNTGGKTVVLKTLGLLSLMVQSGMHIPAAHPSAMPVFKKIFADIGDEQSIEQNLSTFSSHLTNMAGILEEADKESLVLLDELGTGTDPAEGAALGMATLDHLRSREARTVITTHLGALKAYAYQSPEVENASMEFDRGTLLPTYRLLLGQPGSSNALAIARRYKIPNEVLDRMEELLKDENEDTSDLINRVQHVKSVAEKARRRNEKLRVKLTQSIKDTEKEKITIKEEAEARISYIMDDIVKEVEEFSRNVDLAPEPWKGLIGKLRERVLSISKGTPREQHRLEFLAGLKPGDSVYVTNLRTFGEVVKINQRQKTARLKAEGLLYDVPFNNLEEKPFSLPDSRKLVVPIVKKEEKKVAPPPLPVVRKRSESTPKQFLEKLKAGDMVFLPQFQDKGTVVKIDRAKNKAKVKFGAVEVQVPFDTLEKP